MGSTIIASAMIRRVQERYARRRALLLHLQEKRREPPPPRALPRGVHLHASATTRSAHMATDVWRFMHFCRARADRHGDRPRAVLPHLLAAEPALGGDARGSAFTTTAARASIRGEHLTHRVNYNAYHHMSQNFTALVEALEAPDEIPTPKRAIPVQQPPVRVPLDPDAFAYVQAELQRCYPLTAQHNIIVVNHDAGGMLPIRTWPRERYTALIERLLANDPRRVVVLMGISEAAESAREITARVGDPRCIDFVGRTRTLTDVMPALPPERSAHHQRQRPGALRDPDPHQEHHALRARNPGPLRHPRRAQRRSVREAGVQPLPVRLEPPPQPVHRQQVPAGNQRRRGAPDRRAPPARYQSTRSHAAGGGRGLIRP